MLMYALLIVYIIIALFVYAITTSPPLFAPANAPPRNSVTTGLMYGLGWPLIVVGLPLAYVGYAILNVFTGPTAEERRVSQLANEKLVADDLKRQRDEHDARLKLEQAAIDAIRANDAAAREKTIAPVLAITVTPAVAAAPATIAAK